MTDAMFYNPNAAPSGVQSPRCYTRAELRSARRLGMLDKGRPTQPATFGGPAFWATGPGWFDELERREKAAKRQLEDIEIMRAAMAREWGKEF